MAIEPDNKDWTWVTERVCPDCGFDPAGTTPERVSQMVLEQPVRWEAVLHREDVAVRPDDGTWSPLEYAAHVRDVLELFRERLHLMVQTDGAAFDNWDQDATAVAKEYRTESPRRVLRQISEEATLTARAFRETPEAALGHHGLRSNGSSFTVTTLSAYFLHDLAHHLYDVKG
ncbi:MULTISPECIES: DinB family protein [Arthrobacter]|uniref:DinB family protein n=2 Tax=Arthrobacter TaxID=1663 RepID=A0ABU9KHK5_9MICC|nr:DinB family protein [Arthrobacter sp. YJM1]MDP5225843.1 DinB family protein [Arthrobacter sp. YJM1]